jgi:hypothetical protein
LFFGLIGSLFHKKGGLGATPAFAAAPTSPFFQDNLLNIQSTQFSRKIFKPKSPDKVLPCPGFFKGTNN